MIAALIEFAALVAACVREELASWNTPGEHHLCWWDIADDRTIALAQGISGTGECYGLPLGGYDTTDDAWTTAGWA
jgi:hypothetical protein